MTEIHESLTDILHANHPDPKRKKIRKVVTVQDKKNQNIADAALVGTSEAQAPVKENTQTQITNTENPMDAASLRAEVEREKKNNQKLIDKHKRDVLGSIFMNVPNDETREALIKKYKNENVEFLEELAADILKHGIPKKDSSRKQALYGSYKNNNNEIVFPLSSEASNRPYKSKSLTKILSGE